jgi:YHS domain-containing protein
VLWSGGISFSGVLAFIYADLIIIPIVNAYRKYYGGRFAVRLVAIMFGAMVVAALAVDGLFSLLGLVPTHRPSIDSISARPITWNYTAALNVIFLGLFVALIALTMRRGERDPVCGMTVDRHAGLPTSVHGGRTFSFCSSRCQSTFDENPEAYT